MFSGMSWPKSFSSKELRKSGWLYFCAPSFLLEGCRFACLVLIFWIDEAPLIDCLVRLDLAGTVIEELVDFLRF